MRLIGVDWTLSDFDILDTIYNLLGVDENGNNTPHGVIAGVIRIESAKESVVNEYKRKFVGLDFIVGAYDDENYIATDYGEAITTHDDKVLLYS